MTLTSVTLPKTLSNIEASAFAGCLTPTPPVCAADTFDGIDTDIPITVMMASVDNYLNATGWDRFFNYNGTY